MEHIIKQLKKAAKHTRMSVTEKSDMKNVLLRHVKSNPVSNEVLARHHKTKAHAILSPLQINNLRNKKTMPILVILGLLMGGSASFAAETTVPGDVLYPVKVHVNESVRGAVTVSPTAKAEWELHLVERRLEEVEKLATRPNAAPQAQEQAQENLVKYTKHVEDRIAKFEEGEDSDHAIKTASDLSNVLAAYEQLLAALAATQPASTTTSTSTATTTPATTATSTATSTPVVATTTPVTTLTPANIAALREILSKLNDAQDDAEEKHKELKKKYNKEEKDNKKDGDEDEEDDDNDRAHWTLTPVVPSVATTTPGTTSTSTATTTPGTVATSTQRISIEKHDEDNHREEIRTTTVASSTATTTPRVSRERTESRDSHDDND